MKFCVFTAVTGPSLDELRDDLRPMVPGVSPEAALIGRHRGQPRRRGDCSCRPTCIISGHHTQGCRSLVSSVLLV